MCQAQIAIDHVALGIQHGCALLHSLHERAVRKVSPLERIDTMTFRFFYYEGIHGSLADGVQGLLGLFQKVNATEKFRRLVFHVMPLQPGPWLHSKRSRCKT